MDFTHKNGKSPIDTHRHFLDGAVARLMQAVETANGVPVADDESSLSFE